MLPALLSRELGMVSVMQMVVARVSLWLKYTAAWSQRTGHDWRLKARWS